MTSYPFFALVACFGLTVLSTPPAGAFEPLAGQFDADAACPAFQSIRNTTNPGDVTTRPGTSYTVQGLNKTGGDYVLVEIPDAPVTTQRWVETTCGQLTPASIAERQGESTDNVLALNWQPAICETRSHLPECKALNSGRLPRAVAQLSIHGLWPQPRDNVYCGVDPALVRLDESGNWDRLPEPDVDRETRRNLTDAMPGIASGLERHEWIKHGTCYRGLGGADEYFDDTLLLTDAINQSELGDFLPNGIGQYISIRRIRDAFNRSFGDGTGERVSLVCTEDGTRNLALEIRVNLKGQISPQTPISELLKAASPVAPGCRGGIIDGAGLQ
ncbi:ribonuclease T2 [Roseibium hamelinense]|uniref:Ribonuclease T2 n=1 Tax=Roseibium hamelinense TaxID=150831 RepID=A0A562SYM8_9HYPH|nr:ribonuclease T [Roseibium hamelinense]TWI86138.1 ribonuclease T2 [Roseibium hamelinense]